jgi:zinc resistance-associated protein
MMWKTVLAGTTALAIAGASFAFADQGPGRPDHMQRWQHHRHMSAADIAAFSDARIAALHAGLELTPDQEKNWPAVESALHALAKQRVDRIEARKTAQPAADPVARLSRRADALEARGTVLKKLADAAGPLYQSLDEAQKHRFAMLARLDRLRFGHWGMHHDGRGHDGWRHHDRRGPEGGAQPL